MNSIKKLTASALVIALYIVIMYTTQGFAFGQYQIRIATSLYALSYIYPYLVFPLGLANFLSNTIMGGLGPLDMFGGALAGILTAGTVCYIRKFRLNQWLIALAIIFIPGLIVPIWLSILLKLPYVVLATSLCIGQVLPGISGVILVKQFKRVLSKWDISD
ncbi:QueT transporter family protein [Bacillota bacterium LX-D]|nr:QueT transporter family protein [Bacillota bacterium LX-D]